MGFKSGSININETPKGLVVRLLLHRLIAGIEDVRLAGVPLAFNAGDDPVARTDDVTAFEGLDPTVSLHDLTAMLAGPVWIGPTRHVTDVEAHHLTFGEKDLAVMHDLLRMVFRVVTVFEPTVGDDGYGLFAEQRHDVDS
jgi:hypothetical protein